MKTLVKIAVMLATASTASTRMAMDQQKRCYQINHALIAEVTELPVIVHFVQLDDLELSLPYTPNHRMRCTNKAISSTMPSPPPHNHGDSKDCKQK